MNKSTKSHRSRKAADRPKKPYHNFPLTPHASGAWQKKIKGDIYYFGRWANRTKGKLVRMPGDGWEASLNDYEARIRDILAGTPPVPRGNDLLMKKLCNEFLKAKQRKRDAGEMTVRSFGEYFEVTDLLVQEFGKDRKVHDLKPQDFEALRAVMARRWGPVRLANAVTRVKSVF